MSKVKLVDLNKQVAAKSDEVLGRILNLQTEAQQQISVLKRIEAELIKKTREDAEKAKAAELESKRKEEEQRKVQQKAEQESVQNTAPVQKPEIEDKKPAEPKPAAVPPAVEIKEQKKAEEKPAEPRVQPVAEVAAPVAEPRKVAAPEQAAAVKAEPAPKAPVKEKPAEEAAPVSTVKPEAQKPDNGNAEKPQQSKPQETVQAENREARPQREVQRPPYDNNRNYDRREPRQGNQNMRTENQGTDTQNTDNRSPRGEGQYQQRGEGQYQRREGGYQPRGEGQYQQRREGGQYPPREGGYQPRGDGQYQRREGGQYPPREGGYQPRGDGQQRREGGQYPPREGGYQPRGEGQYQRREGGQYPPREGGYQPRGDGQYQRREGGQYPPREGGYQPRGEGQYQRREGGQYPPREGGYQPRGDGQYQRREGGQYPPREGGYQPRGDGQYQRREGGQYPPREGGYQPREGGQYPRREGGQYPPREGGYQQRPGGQYPPRSDAQGGFNKDRFDKDSDRPQQRSSQKPKNKLNLPSDFTPPVEKQKVSNYGKKLPEKKTEADSKNKVSKKLLVQETRIMEAEDDGMPRGSKKQRGRKEKPVFVFEPIKIDKATITTEMVSIKTLADKTGKPASDIIKKLFLLGIVCTINTEISFDTAQLVCTDFGIELELKLEKTAEDTLNEEDKEDKAEDLEIRPPVVTIMGHVDHGKTSLLDAIRSTKVTEQEAGGITQHIGAYSIKLKGRAITFLDTPGHEAFTAMRARGAQVTDIAILVVAADDGIMPQTVEAINHAKAAKVPIIVAVNKIDKPNANLDRIKQELTEHELLAEEWGGDTVVVPVSAVTHEGIDQLLEMILLVADVQELKANPNRLAKGTIIEARLDKGRGPVATVLVQNGTLKVTDTIVAGTAYGRVRAMTDDNGRNVKEAKPSMPVEVIGFSEVPVAGDIIFAVEQDKLSRQVAEERRDKQKADMLKSIAKVSLDDLFSKIAEGSVKDLNLIVKADVQGSVEAVTQALEKLSNDEVSVKIIHAGVGAIQKTDIVLASASSAIIIGFNVRADNMAREAAEKENIDIRYYRIIYNAIEDIEKALKGMLKPQYEEVVLGHAQIRTLFKVSAIGTIAGSYVTDGKIVRNAQIRLLRDNIVIHEGTISSLKRFKDDAKEVQTGYECGITLDNFNDLRELDVIEAFEMREIKR